MATAGAWSLRHVHVTRMTPARWRRWPAARSLGDWVEIAARERSSIEPFRDKDGIGRCRLVMQPGFAAAATMARSGLALDRGDAAPPDLTKSSAASVAAMPKGNAPRIRGDRLLDLAHRRRAVP
jgi:hypothetical protein